jgi:hypothetical protein
VLGWNCERSSASGGAARAGLSTGNAQQTVDESAKMAVGKDISPYVGMRVRHAAGKDHKSSRGLLGTIEIIPGRGYLRPDERSVSVRWDADTMDVRGPYYTGEPVEDEAGVVTEKFELVAAEDVMENEADKDIMEADEAGKDSQSGSDNDRMSDQHLQELLSEKCRRAERTLADIERHELTQNVRLILSLACPDHMPIRSR